MLIEVLPPVLVLHINRVRYDPAAGGIRKIGKSIRFGPDLEIPLGTIFTSIEATKTETTSWSFQALWYPMPDDP